MSTRAPRVLVSGVVLAQPASGVRRFAESVLPRVARTLAEDGGRLVLLEPRGGTGLPGDALERLASDVPVAAPWRRWNAERDALARAWRDAADAGRPFDAVWSGHLPLPEVPGATHVHLVHDLRALHGYGPWWKRLGAARVVRRAVHRAEVVVCVGRAVADELCERWPRVDPRVVGHGGDHLPLVPRAPEGFVLVVGHLEPRKGLRTVLDAWERHADLPRLVLVGRGPDVGALERRVVRSGLGERVSFAGAVDDAALADLYARAGCAAFPSRLEGFGIGLLEARRAGVPIAASAIPAHLALLDDDDARFPPGDADALAAAVRRALTTEARPRAVPGWDAAADAWVAIFRELVGTRPDAPFVRRAR